MQQSAEKSWHNESAENCLNNLSSSERGLNDAAVTERRKQYGLNQLPLAKTASPQKRLLR